MAACTMYSKYVCRLTCFSEKPVSKKCENNAFYVEDGLGSPKLVFGGWCITLAEKKKSPVNRHKYCISKHAVL
jgi:hypothetical protein